MIKKKQLAAGVHKTEDKNSASVSNGKKQFFFRFGRIPQDAACKTSMDPPDIFEAVIYSRWP